MPFLVVDNRYGTPIHVFLDDDPSGSPGYPGLPVRAVRLGELDPAQRCGPSGPVVGQHPLAGDVFREFGSDGAVAAAHYSLVEPRYVGPTWSAYLTSFRPGGEPCGRRS